MAHEAAGAGEAVGDVMCAHVVAVLCCGSRDQDVEPMLGRVKVRIADRKGLVMGGDGR